MVEWNAAQFDGQNYISLETFRKSGLGVKTPVWFVLHDGPVIRILGRAAELSTATPPRVNCHLSGTALPVLNALPAGGGRFWTPTKPYVSVTTTEKEETDVFPCVSLAVQVTVVVPIGKSDPDGSVQATGTSPSIASTAMGFV